jgi:hypothetical protein
VDEILEWLEAGHTDATPALIAAANSTLQDLLLFKEAQLGLQRLLQRGRGACLQPFSQEERFKDDHNGIKQADQERTKVCQCCLNVLSTFPPCFINVP